jgi:hypothetical protein
MRHSSVASIVALLFLTSPTKADETLPQSRAEARRMESMDALPMTRFYDPPGRAIGSRKSRGRAIVPRPDKT